MSNGNIALVNFDGGIRIRTGLRVKQQCIADNVGFGVFGAFVNFDQAAERSLPAALADGLRSDLAGGVGGKMHHLRTGVLDLPRAGEGHRKHFAMRAGFHQIAGGIFHGQLGTQVGIHPLMRGIAINLGALGHQVVYIG